MLRTIYSSQKPPLCTVLLSKNYTLENSVECRHASFHRPRSSGPLSSKTNFFAFGIHSGFRTSKNEKKILYNQQVLQTPIPGDLKLLDTLGPASMLPQIPMLSDLVSLLK